MGLLGEGNNALLLAKIGTGDFFTDPSGSGHRFLLLPEVLSDCASDRGDRLVGLPYQQIRFRCTGAQASEPVFRFELDADGIGRE
jgi:hypothetical protein